MNTDQDDPADQDAAAVRARVYRQGFNAGARAILDAIGDGLPEQQMAMLRTWVAGPLDTWCRAEPGAEPPPPPMIDPA